MPVRNIPIQNRSVAGYFYSHKNQKSLAYESQLEKKCFFMLEFEQEVVSYKEQPLKIGRYIPDVLVQKRSGSFILIEVKYSQESENPNDKLQAKFLKLKEFCKEKEWEFKIFTEKDIVLPYFDNILFLYRYIKQPVKQLYEILEFINKKGETDINTLLEEGGYAISDIYTLLAQGRININLHKELSLYSIIKAVDE